MTTTLSLSFALLMTATFYFAIRAGIEEHDALQSELRSLLAIHRQAEDLRGQISEAQARASFLQRQRADAVPIVASMSKIARALPDDGWVEQITFENGVITLRGYAKDAAQAQQRLNSELDATDIRFAAPVVRDDKTGSDRFVLEIRHRRPASG